MRRITIVTCDFEPSGNGDHTKWSAMRRRLATLHPAMRCRQENVGHGRTGRRSALFGESKHIRRRQRSIERISPVSTRLARPPATLLPLTPLQLRIVRKIAYGAATTAIASELSLTISSVNVQVTLCGRKLGASGRAAVVHATFATHQLLRPERADAPGEFSDQHIEAWRMVAIGATSRVYAQRVHTSRGEALRRVTALREFVGAVNAPHLVTLGWAHGQLDDSLTKMATGHLLRAPVRAGARRRQGRGRPLAEHLTRTPPPQQHQHVAIGPDQTAGAPHRLFPVRTGLGELDG
ncbi:regulatory protein [Streptomyces turgidiscabies Car8]|uniref:Regulatory protein n=1 Tax=Streptomyces turgidiscabies (strain Car8) TaxID=698760 RepID=L7F3J7_STRT8|nr:regulatory protein [Streptomyces turgidiscabies Car8]GAQ75935.1 hypothetical protein T45_07723 [Streptomyces turgidiscabies]